MLLSIGAILGFIISYILPVIDFSLGMYDRFSKSHPSSPQQQSSSSSYNQNSRYIDNLKYIQEKMPLILLVTSIILFIINIDFSQPTWITVLYHPFIQVSFTLLKFNIVFGLLQAITSLFKKRFILKNIFQGIFYLIICYFNYLTQEGLNEVSFNSFDTTTFSKEHPAVIIFSMLFVLLITTLLLDISLETKIFTGTLRNDVKLFYPYFFIFLIAFLLAWFFSPKAYPFEQISQYLQHLINSKLPQIQELPKKKLN